VLNKKVHVLVFYTLLNLNCNLRVQELSKKLLPLSP